MSVSKSFKLTTLIMSVFLYSCKSDSHDAPASSSQIAEPSQDDNLTQTKPENYYAFSPRILSGAEPHEGDFEFLAAQGIVMMLSVDGAKPKVEQAEQHGLSYVHLPIGYDTISEEVIASIAEVAEQLADKKIYIHCHHGKHRGPAVAAIFSILNQELNKTEALSAMQTIGTGKEYQGLWESVKSFNATAINKEKALPLTSAMEVSDFVASMALVDRHYDAVKLHMKSEGTKLELNNELLLLKEALKESHRLNPSETKSDEKFNALFQENIQLATELEQYAQQKDYLSLKDTFKDLKKSCKSWHTQFRNYPHFPTLKYTFIPLIHSP